MIGLDTNVLLRLCDEDDLAQRNRARASSTPQADEPCFVNAVVLAEFAWTLARI